jgi:SAM-dependent methyltransferase
VNAARTGEHARRFWDRRARENALYFVDNRLRYDDPDPARFWADGERDLDALLNTLGLRVEGDETILDIGCGVGRLTRPLAVRARRVVGIDVSPEMLKLAQDHNADLANIVWLLGDGRTLNPVEDGTIDGCVSHVVFQHLPDVSAIFSYIREMGRVLKSDGWAAFQVSNDPSLHRRPTSVSRLRTAMLSRIRKRPRGQSDPAWLGTSVDLNQLSTIATDSSLTLETVVGEGTQFCLIRARRIRGRTDP